MILPAHSHCRSSQATQLPRSLIPFLIEKVGELILERNVVERSSRWGETGAGAAEERSTSTSNNRNINRDTNTNKHMHWKTHANINSKTNAKPCANRHRHANTNIALTCQDVPWRLRSGVKVADHHFPG